MFGKFSWPDLSSEQRERSTAVYLARSIGGASINAGDLTFRKQTASFFRIADSAVADFETARRACNDYFGDPHLGATTPITERLIPYWSSIEHCVVQTHRALRFAQVIANHAIGQSLIPATDWDELTKFADPIRKIRNAIQHADERLEKADPPGGGFAPGCTSPAAAEGSCSARSRRPSATACHAAR